MYIYLFHCDLLYSSVVEFLTSTEMAFSLEKLLVEEGFKVRSLARSSFNAARMSSYTSRDQYKNDSVLGHRYKMERARSEVARHSSRSELPPNDSRGR